MVCVAGILDPDISIYLRNRGQQVMITKKTPANGRVLKVRGSGDRGRAPRRLHGSIHSAPRKVYCVRCAGLITTVWAERRFGRSLHLRELAGIG